MDFLNLSLARGRIINMAGFCMHLLKESYLPTLKVVLYYTVELTHS